MDNIGDISKDDGTSGSKAGERGGETVDNTGERGGERGGEERGGEERVGTNVSVVSTLVDEIGFRDRAPILGSKLAGKLDFGP